MVCVAVPTWCGRSSPTPPGNRPAAANRRPMAKTARNKSRPNRADTSHREGAPRAGDDRPSDADQPVLLPPLKPNRKLFYATGIVLVVWTIILVALYFITYSHRNEPQLDPPVVDRPAIDQPPTDGGPPPILPRAPEGTIQR